MSNETNKYNFEYTAFEAAELAELARINKVVKRGDDSEGYIIYQCYSNGLLVTEKFKYKFEHGKLKYIKDKNGFNVGESVGGNPLDILNEKKWHPFIEQKQLPENIEKILGKHGFGCKEKSVRELVAAILEEVK